MAYSKVYTRINWVNKSEGTQTPLGATNLNTIDYAVDELDNRVIEQETLKLDKATALTMISDWSMDKETGIITITKLNGEQIVFDLNIEKIPVNFALSEDGIVTMTTDDGTEFTANIGDMIPVLEFKSSDEIAVTVTGEGKDKTYSFSIKEGSIKEKHLQPNYLADIKVQAANAQSSAEAAAISETNAKVSETNAAIYADQAKAVSNTQVAINTQTLGYTKKNLYNNINNNVASSTDGIIVTVNEDGSFNVTGTATSAFNAVQKKFVLPEGTYIYSLKKSVLDSNVATALYNRTSELFISYGNSNIEFTLDTESTLDVRVQINSGATANLSNQAVMIRSADITDDTYEPYVDDVDTRLNAVETEIEEIPNTYATKTELKNLSDVVGEVNALLDII